MKIEFKALTDAELPLIRRWLEVPHVKAVWDSELEVEASLEKHAVRMASNFVKQFVVHVDGVPIGYFQYYWAAKVGGGWWGGYGDDVVGMDMYLGEVSYLGRGLGEITIRAFVDMLFCDDRVQQIIVDPHPENFRMHRLLTKIGFENRGEILTPDGDARLFALHKKSFPGT